MELDEGGTGCGNPQETLDSNGRTPRNSRICLEISHLNDLKSIVSVIYTISCKKNCHRILYLLKWFFLRLNRAQQNSGSSLCTTSRCHSQAPKPISSKTQCDIIIPTSVGYFQTTGHYSTNLLHSITDFTINRRTNAEVNRANVTRRV